MERMIDVLKEVAEKFKPEVIGKATYQLKRWSPESLELFRHIYGSYYKDVMLGRWYDPYHVAYSTLFAVKLVEFKEASPLIVPAIILHDIGYYSPLVDKANWASKNSRIIHMQEGAGLAAEILSTIGGFTASEIGKIVGMVASHDNGYLGIPTTDGDRLALRDADRAWVMHPLSFYKDWIAKRRGGEKLSLSDLFQSRVASFYLPEEIHSGRRAEVPDKEDAIQTSPFTNLAKKWRDIQFESRFNEIQESIIDNLEHFRRRVEWEIRSELTLGRE